MVLSFKKIDHRIKTLVYSMFVVALVFGGLLYGVGSNTAGAAGNEAGKAAAPVAPAATFPGTGTGAIPDGVTCGTPGTPINVSFNVTGISGAPASVVVDMTFGSPIHTWVGDVTATLIAPNGASANLFGRTGATTATGVGDSTDLSGPYAFSDAAAAPPSGGWWQEAVVQPTGSPMTPGSYRSTAIGGAGATIPMPATSLNPVFAGIPTSNGTWTLRFTDSCGGDTGAVAAANLTLTPATVAKAPFDFNGDGKTDYTVARNVGAGTSGTTAQIRWITSLNGSGTVVGTDWGDSLTDFITPSDFDGDNKTDIAVWREAASTVAAFYILQSGTNTLRTETFGQTGDDPAIIGDYDGDGKSDPAVFRCPVFGGPAGQCFFYFRGSNANPGGNVTFVPWGFGVDGDFFPNAGDFDGDGKYDFCIQRANPSAPTLGQFVLKRSSDSGVEYVNWGNSSDFIIPGDYDGDGKADFCVRRTVGGARQHWILTRTGATSLTTWGITGDASAPGDYDGDGKTDLAIWRGSATPGASMFWVLNSSTAAVQQLQWGQCPAGNCDFAVAGAYVH